MGDSRTCSSINHNDSIDVKETNDAIQRETICKSNIPRKLRKEWNLEHKQGIGFCYQEGNFSYCNGKNEEEECT